METVRAFVGCMLDLGATRRVVELSRATRLRAESAGWSVRWVPPPNLHVTLRFLGDIDRGLVDPIVTALRDVARSTPPLVVGLSGLSAFPDRAAPEVIFAEVARGHGSLEAVVAKLEDALEALGIARSDRRFVGHVTLGRVQYRQGGLDAVAPAVTDCGAGTVTAIDLYRSDLFSKSSEYVSLGRALLGTER